MTPLPDGGPTLGELIESGLPIETVAALTIDPEQLARQIHTRIAVGAWNPETSMLDRAVLLVGGYLWPDLFGLKLRHLTAEAADDETPPVPA